MRRRRSRVAAVVLAATAALAAGPAAPAFADTSPGPTVKTPSGATLPCLPEQFPHGGASRSAPSTPYEIPFTATLGDPSTNQGGYLEISNSLVTAVLGTPLTPIPTDPTQDYGTVFASLCGQMQLPSEDGTIQANPTYGKGVDKYYNNNFSFENLQGQDSFNVTLTVTGIPGLSVLPPLHAYAAADGEMTAAIEKTPAGNGGLQADFYGGAKSTSDFGPAISALLAYLLPTSPVSIPPSLQSILNNLTESAGNVAGSECTIAIGNLIDDGVDSQYLSGTGLSYAQATTPVHLTTQKSGNLTGKPVTGPITGAVATLASNDFAVGAILPTPEITPVPDDAGAQCTAQNAKLLNNLLGLPSIPDPAAGRYPNTFFAPGTFAVYTSS